jgi:hypothetical protein
MPPLKRALALALVATGILLPVASGTAIAAPTSTEQTVWSDTLHCC